ncbi:MAG TPA: c-type cytochrome, partial [Candidatus Eremiobacteraceae bacterium]|nr:c-type cytochrome [Candidatus Eremiobacteraceae bacterium]
MTAPDPAFWRAGAMSSLIVMLVVLIFLTRDTLNVIKAGGAHVPDYTVINQQVSYGYDAAAGHDVPTIGGPETLFGHSYTTSEAAALVRQGKLVIQSRACMDCHTFFGNGAYYAPDLTKSWLDPVWATMWMPMTGTHTKADAMVAFLMRPDKYVTWRRQMPNLHLSTSEAQATVAYLKWLSTV